MVSLAHLKQINTKKNYNCNTALQHKNVRTGLATISSGTIHENTNR